MPERLDLITIALNAGNITIGRNTRQALLGRLQHIGEQQMLRNSFHAVGATRPVELTVGPEGRAAGGTRRVVERRYARRARRTLRRAHREMADDE